MKMVLWLSVISLLLFSLTTELHSLQGKPVPQPEFKLVGGTSRCSGTMRKKHYGRWQVYERDTFKIEEAHEVCRQLDCGTAVSTQTFYDWYSYLEVICSESVRLVNGTGSCSGRLEVKSDQSWVSVCEGDFDQQDAAVACRHLGCGTHPFLLGALYGEANVPMWTKEFQCEGNESVLLDCRTLDSTRNTCSPDKAVGFTCDDTMRLVNGGGSSCSGRLEVKSDLSWVSVCEGDFDQQDAEVACRQLDCGTYPVHMGVLYGEATVPMWTKEFQCEGNESVLLDCRTSDSTRNICSPDKAVGLTCNDYPRYYISKEKKNWEESRQWCKDRQSDLIVINSKEEQDFVESVNKTVWLGLNDHYEEGSFEWVDGTQLTTPTYWSPGNPNNQDGNQDCVEFSDGSKPPPERGWNDLPCDHNAYWICEQALQDQPTPKPKPGVKLVGGTSRCSGRLWAWKEQERKWATVEDKEFKMKEAHEVCRKLDCGTAASKKIIQVDGKWWIIRVEVICSDSVRLVNGTGSCSGRLEVKSDQSWVSLCEGDFDQQDAEVACRQLGCGTHPFLLGALYGEATVPMWTKEFQCEGNESVLLDCRTSDSTRNTCSPDKAVGLTCNGVTMMYETSKCVGTLTEKPDAEWITVYPSDRVWNLMETHQVCKQLDCGSATSTGSSDSLGFWIKRGMDQMEVICSDVRLVGGTSGCSGTLEKKLDGEWSPVTDHFFEFELRTAHEVCRQLDCGTAVSTQTTGGNSPDNWLASNRTVEVTCSEYVRLVNGTSWCSGRVEVKSNQSWVSVCEGDFDQQDAEVVCRQLACGPPLVLQGALYGEANVPMWTKELQCKGNESLLDCRISDSARNTCSPDKAVGLTCSDYKLVEADSNCVGKLRERYDGGWRYLNNDKTWNLMKEKQLCRQLHCGPAASGIWFDFESYDGKEVFICSDLRLVGGTSHCNGKLEKEDNREWVTVQDGGHAIGLRAAHEVCRQLDCGTAVSTETTGSPWHPKTTNMICSESVRLVNGPNEYSGRVEVKSNQSWVSVCEGDLDQQDAEVVCRQLGGGSHAVLHGALSGEANVPMWTKEFQCEGNETVLLDCITSDSARNTCSPDKAVGLTCARVRLVGGTSNCTGVLEMEYYKEWRPVVATNGYSDWDMKASHVVCRQLACGHALSTDRRHGSNRHASWKIIPQCEGSEFSANDCISKEYNASGQTRFLREITCSGPPDVRRK